MGYFVASLLLAAFAAGPQAPTPVTGRVVDAQSGEPLAGATIVFVPADAPTRALVQARPFRTETNGRGVFNLDLPLGRYRLQIQRAGFIDEGMMIAIDGAATGIADIRLARGGAIEGRVFDAKGRPLAGVSVFAVRPATGVTATAFAPRLAGRNGQSDDRGQFRVSSLPPGTYVVVGQPRPQASGASMFVTTYHMGSTEISLARPIEVTAGSTISDVDIQLQQAPTVTVSGLVVDVADRPVGGALVSFMSFDALPLNVPARTTTRSDGTFRVAVPRGKYRVVASVPIVVPAGGSVSTSSSGGAANPGVEVTVEASAVSGIKVTADRR